MGLKKQKSFKKLTLSKSLRPDPVIGITILDFSFITPDSINFSVPARAAAQVISERNPQLANSLCQFKY